MEQFRLFLESYSGKNYMTVHALYLVLLFHYNTVV